MDEQRVEPAREAPLPDSMIQAVRAGAWTALAAALTVEPGENRGDRALLHCLAAGQADGDPPPLPSYRLARRIGPTIAPALRLADIARALDPDRAAATLRVA